MNLQASSGKNHGAAMKTLHQLVEENFFSQEREEIRRKAGEKIAAVRLRQVR